MNYVGIFTVAICVLKFAVSPVWAASEDPEPLHTIEKAKVVSAGEQSYSVGSTYRAQFIYPSNYGSAGLFRLRSAESLPDGTFTFGIGGEFFSVLNAPNVSGTGSNANGIAESLFVGFAPTPHLTLAMMRRNSSTTYGVPSQLISSLGDFNFSALYSFELGESFSIAPILDVLVASEFNNLAPSGNTVSVGAGASASLSLYPSLGIPFMGHANIKYHMPQVRADSAFTTGSIRPETFFSFSRYNTVSVGFGVEYQIGNFIPFAEFQEVYHMYSAVPIEGSPSRVTFGTRIMPLENKSLSLLVGADIGINKTIVAGMPFNPDWQAVAQASYTVAVSNTERKHYFTTHNVRVVNRKFVIGKNINFKVGSAELESASHHVLNEIAQVIKENDIQKLMIVGHTDSSHTEDYNLKLSIDRANAVKNYLVSQGVHEDGLVTQGYGRRKPKASNLTEAGRALNRRVEFYIID